MVDKTAMLKSIMKFKIYWKKIFILQIVLAALVSCVGHIDVKLNRNSLPQISPAVLTNIAIVNSMIQIKALTATEKEISTSTTPIALWHLNELNAANTSTIVDSTGAHHGVLTTDNGSSIKSVAGKLNGSINLDGIGDYIQFPDANYLDLAGDYTIWTWVNPASFGEGNTGRIIEHGGATDGWSLYLDNGVDNTFGFNFKINGVAAAPSFIKSEVNAIKLNRWSHVAVTCQAGTIKIWLNAGIVGMQSGVPGIIASADPIVIGKSSTAMNRYFNGQIDEVAIWNRALTQSEIEILYKKQSGDYGNNNSNSYISTPQDSKNSSKVWTNFNPVPLSPYYKQMVSAMGESTSYNLGGVDTTGLVGYWDLNGAIGAIANGDAFTDLSGNGNNGMAVNGGTGIQRALGKLGEAVYFGGNDTINIPSTASTSVSTYLTLSGWVRPSSFQNGWHAIAGKGQWNYWLQIGGTGGAMSPVLGMNSDPGGTEVVSAVPIPIDSWSFVVGTYDGAQTKIYVNGILTGTKAVTGPINTSGGNFTIGSADSTEFLNGWVDEVTVWNRALSANEIMAMYIRGSMKIKYQVRSCQIYDCSDSIFMGPDNTANTYFSEFTNATSGLPFFDISSVVVPNRYIQYKAVFETDDSNYTPILLNASFN